MLFWHNCFYCNKFYWPIKLKSNTLLYLWNIVTIFSSAVLITIIRVYVIFSFRSCVKYLSISKIFVISIIEFVRYILQKCSSLIHIPYFWFHYFILLLILLRSLGALPNILFVAFVMVIFFFLKYLRDFCQFLLSY